MRGLNKDESIKIISEINDKGDIDEAVYKEKVDILYRLLSVSIPANFICAFILFLSLYHNINKLAIVSWFGTVVFLTLFRIVMTFIYQRKPQKPHFFLAIFILLNALSASLWGLAGSVLMYQQDVLHQMITIIILAGVTAGGSQTLQANLYASLLFILLSVAPLVVWLFLQPNFPYFLIAAAMLTYFIFMIIVAFKNVTQVDKVVRLGFENLKLISNLSTSNLQLERINKSLQNAHEELKEMAYYDPLTGLANRKMLDILAKKSFEYADRYKNQVAVCYLDLDHFKKINDNLGHEAGDMVLTIIGARLQHVLRETDVLARLGGDEFIVLITAVTENQNLVSAINKIRQVIAEKIIINQNAVFITTSVGVSIYPGNGVELSVLLRDADKALYAVKVESRNNFKLYDEIKK